MIVNDTNGSVLKVAKPNRAAKRMLRNEFELLQRLAFCEAVVDALELTKSGMTLKHAGVDLFTYLEEQCPTMGTKLFIVRQLLDAVGAIHDRGVSHCDLKLENMCIDKGQLTLIDFGMGTTKSYCKKLCGSALYSSPEKWTGRPYNCMKADAWALAVCAIGIISDLKCIFPKAVLDCPLFSAFHSFTINGLTSMEAIVRMMHIDLTPIEFIVNTCLVIDPKRRHSIVHNEMRLHKAWMAHNLAFA